MFIPHTHSQEDFLSSNLDPQQIEAAQHLEGPLLILAGAGSGKTRTLTYRIANLILQNKVQGHNVLAVTFTNKAATELKEKISELLQNLGQPFTQVPWVGTFHSICVRLLKEFYNDSFTIYDSSDQAALIKKILKSFQMQEKLYPPRKLREEFSQAKQKSLLPHHLLSNQNSDISMDRETLRVYEAYEVEKDAANALDFTDLLLKTIELLKNSEEICDILSHRFQHLFVDEYQDTNDLQYQFIHCLTRAHNNICVVGDEDQSIYSWRGANVKNILSFKNHFPEAKVIKLEQNYRSTGTIIAAANSVIKNNSFRTPKTLFTNNIAGSKIDVIPCQSDYDEADYVTEQILSIQNQSHNLKLSDIGVLYRTNSQSRTLEEKLAARHIPYFIVGTAKFFERKEIKDILAYLKILENPSDTVSLLRIINIPSRKIGTATLAKIGQWANHLSLPFMTALNRSAEILPLSKAKQIQNFLNTYKTLENFKKDHDLQDLVDHVLEVSGYIKMLEKENTTEALSRIENLQEFKNAIQYFMDSHEDVSLKSFLDEVALTEQVSQNTSREQSVQLMTVHSAKGLEFQYTFVVGLEEDLFPNVRTKLDPMGLEEERRLAYVALTRAKKRLFLSFCQSRFIYGGIQSKAPSRFLMEIPEQHLNWLAPLKHVSSSACSIRSKHHNFSVPQQSSKKVRTTQFKSAGLSYDYDEGEHLIGKTVQHELFGTGQVKKVSSSGGVVKYQVFFERYGLKQIASNYLTVL